MAYGMTAACQSNCGTPAVSLNGAPNSKHWASYAIWSVTGRFFARKGHADLVGLLNIQPKEDRRYALIQPDSGWETTKTEFLCQMISSCL